ncbi:MAG: DUF2892 domain-containing protein [Gammaproteobacteria bacterium]|nr:DUF2892 domain-containing protein [Gammaproteobacteria bacterium]
MNSNLNLTDTFIRFTLGLSAVIAVLATPSLPVWLALVATYPVFTGILKWDPIYAAYLALTKAGAGKRIVDTESLGATA